MIWLLVEEVISLGKEGLYMNDEMSDDDGWIAAGYEPALSTV